MRYSSQHCLLYRRMRKTFSRYQISDDLGIGGRVKYRSAKLQLGSQFIGITDITVVSESHLALLVIYLHRLTVISVVSAGSRVSDMSDCHLGLRQIVKYLLIKNGRNLSQIFM